MKKHQKRLLDKGKIEELVLALRAVVSTNPEAIEKLRIETNYLERNSERLRYLKFRRQHLFAGSGVISDNVFRSDQSGWSQWHHDGRTGCRAGFPPNRAMSFRRRMCEE